MANTYLTRTQSASPTSATKGTLSFWIKRSLLGVSQYFMSVFQDSNNRVQAEFQADDTLRIIQKNSSSTTINIITNRKFRDTNGWLHVVLAFDTTQGTSSNRVKLYINGVQETSFSTATYPGSSIDSFLTKGTSVSLGAYNGTGDFTNGIMSHINLCDGTQYDASAFGSTDSVTGEWKINASPSVTYGTNGFFILKDGNSVTDQSGNSNNFTVGGGTLTKTEDNPSNVFATLNPLIKQGSTLSNGNNTSAYGSASWKSVIATLGMQTGKFYYEAKLVSGSSANFGIIRADSFPSNYETNALGNVTGALAMNLADGSVQAAGGSGGTAQGFTFSAGDIAGCAVDATNNKIYWSKNGVWGNSSNPVDGTNATSIASNLTDYKPFLPAISVNNSTISTNFGNGKFGTTAITTNSGNGYAGAEGSSIFNYQPPTGYSALSTKGLNL